MLDLVSAFVFICGKIWTVKVCKGSDLPTKSFYMTTVPTPTFEQMMALFRESREELDKFRLSLQEADKRREEERIAQEKQREEEQKKREEERIAQAKQREEDRLLQEKKWKMEQKRWNKRFSEFSDRLGELIETMVEGGVVEMFQKLGYSFARCSRNTKFRHPTENISGEVDVFLDNGVYALLVEVKLKLSIGDIKEHIKRIKKYRVCSDARGDQRRIIAAVGGGITDDNVRDFALKRGLYVIRQAGKNFEVIPPEGKPKVW